MALKQQNAYKRKKQLADKLLAIIATSLRSRAADPRLASLTIISVDVSPDMKRADVYYMLPQNIPVLDKYAGKSNNIPETYNQGDIAKTLKHAAGFLQAEIAGRTSLRYIPKLIFKLDTFTDSSIHISRILDSIKDN